MVSDETEARLAHPQHTPQSVQYHRHPPKPRRIQPVIAIC